MPQATLKECLKAVFVGCLGRTATNSFVISPCRKQPENSPNVFSPEQRPNIVPSLESRKVLCDYEAAQPAILRLKWRPYRAHPFPAR
jgi:hypothetical protein